MSHNRATNVLLFTLGLLILITAKHTTRASISAKQIKANQLFSETAVANKEVTNKCNDQQETLITQKATLLHDLEPITLISNQKVHPTLTTMSVPPSRHAEISSLRNRCLESERELDRCSAQLIGLGQSAAGLTYPDSMQELDSVYCPKFRETIACIKNNTNCYKPFERQIINWVLSSTRRMNHKRCKNQNEKIRFLRLTNSCFSSMKNSMDDCMSRYIGQLDAIADYNRDLERLSENDIQIQLACCANNRFKQCVMNSARQGCQSHDSLRKLRRTNSLSSQRVARKQLQRTVQDTIDDLKTTLNEMALTGPEFICSGIDENFCRTKFDGRYSNRIPRHKSIVPAMLRIYADK
jgi:hypothetical protein